MTDPATIYGLLAFGGAFAAVGLVVVGISRLVAHGLPKSQVVEYLPPQAGSIFEHGLAVRADRRVLAAAMIDLAVRGQVRILSARTRRGPVAVQVVPGAQLTSEEREFLAAFRPATMKPRQLRRYRRALQDIGIDVPQETHPDGASLEGPLGEFPEVIFLRGRGAFRTYRRRKLTAFFDAIRAHMTADGLTRKGANSVHLVLLSLLFIAVLFGGLLLMLGALVNGEWVGALVVLLDIALMFWVLSLAAPPLVRFTDQGQALRGHLSGLREYIGLAEQDRLRYLQSPEGALRTPAGATTPAGAALGLSAATADPVTQSNLDRFVLIERLLPYAVLFKQERAWQHEFEQLGGALEISQNMRTLGSTFEGLMAVLEALSIVFQVIRAIGAVTSLFGRI